MAGLSKSNVLVDDFQRKYSTELTGDYFPGSKISVHPGKFSLAIYFELLNLGNTFWRTIRSSKYDAAWISRELMVGYPSFEKFLNKKYIYDIDDAIYLGSRFSKIGIHSLMANASCIFAGNRYLADYCEQFSDSVHVVPTAVDTIRYFPSNKKKDELNFVVGWSGTSSSFSYLVSIEQQLSSFFRSHPGCILKIVSDRYPRELNNIAKYIEFEYWSADEEVAQIQSFDIGIMPLIDNEWIKGKCAYKMLLYASCGIPTVCSSFGMNQEVLSLGEVGFGCSYVEVWAEALDYMYKNRTNLQELFPDCRSVVEENYSLVRIAALVSNLISKSLDS